MPLYLSARNISHFEVLLQQIKFVQEAVKIVSLRALNIPYKLGGIVKNVSTLQKCFETGLLVRHRLGRILTRTDVLFMLLIRCLAMM